jgi:GTP-binding protein EngB required for normal cell division
LALALGAEDRTAVEESLRHGQATDPGYVEAQALGAGTLNEAGAARLAALAPRTAARRFVIDTLAPAPPPAGNLYALLSWAEGLAARHPALLPLRAVEAFDRPLLVAVMGEFNAGKSSFVNALAGRAIAPVGVTPTTATINVLRYGPGGGRAVYHDGTAQELSPDSEPWEGSEPPAMGSGGKAAFPRRDTETVTGFLNALDDEAAAAIRQVEIFAPLETLRRVEIVDTPGLNSLRSAHEKIARDFLNEADAIVWVFAAGQAAKATEREALTLARAAGKRVLAVINKVDGVSTDEIEAVVRHVEAELADLVERVVPLSARAALHAAARGDREALTSSGLPVVQAALESGFFARARELKRATALTTLRRFVADARAALAAVAPVSSPPPDGGAPGGHPRTGVFSTFLTQEEALRSAIAAERVTLRARLDQGIRAAAAEVRELVRPRAWLFGEHSADPQDEAFLRDLLDDGVLAATAKTRAALLAAAVPAGAGVDTGAGAAGDASAAAELTAAIDDAVERFRAYARGIIEGAAAVFFRVDLPRIRLDLTAIRNALSRWSPDPEEALFRPVERAAAAAFARARADLDDRRRAGEIAELMHLAYATLPLQALAGVVVAAAAEGVESVKDDDTEDAGVGGAP